MLEERIIDDIYALAEKLDKGERLMPEEQDLFDDIQEDGEAYSMFCLFTAMMDMPELFAEETKKKRGFYRDREDIERHIAGKAEHANMNFR